MHLQQTKQASLATGGPQYYLHAPTKFIKSVLRDHGAVRVALVTPYGATKTDYFALGKDHKLDKRGKVVPGKVGHDRIQQGEAGESIGESIRKWFNLPKGDFLRIDVEIDVVDEFFYLFPTRCQYAKSPKVKELSRVERPLTFTKEYVSPFWKEQIRYLAKKNADGLVEWSLGEICRVAKDHGKDSKVPHIQEPDLLRASGPLHHLGVSLGPYVGKGYDCYTEFQFLSYPLYTVPVELKRHSKGFTYQLNKYGKDELSRAVILCATHDLPNVPKNVDVIELEAICTHLPHK